MATTLRDCIDIEGFVESFPVPVLPPEKDQPIRCPCMTCDVPLRLRNRRYMKPALRFVTKHILTGHLHREESKEGMDLLGNALVAMMKAKKNGNEIRTTRKVAEILTDFDVHFDVLLTSARDQVADVATATSHVEQEAVAGGNDDSEDSENDEQADDADLSLSESTSAAVAGERIPESTPGTPYVSSADVPLAPISDVSGTRNRLRDMCRCQ